MADKKPIIISSGKLSEIAAGDYLNVQNVRLASGGIVKSAGEIKVNATTFNISSNGRALFRSLTAYPTAVSNMSVGEVLFVNMADSAQGIFVRVGDHIYYWLIDETKMS